MYCVRSLLTDVAKFFGIADLDDEKRKKFLDKWSIRAQKMHDDDLLLTRGRGKKQRLEQPSVTFRSAKQREVQQREEATDVTDGQCVSSPLFRIFSGSVGQQRSSL